MQPGMTVGSYRIIEQVGLGGMATVFKAYDPGTERYVAIKIISPQFAQHPEFRERFRREAKAIANLEHPRIVPVHAFGEEGETAYLVLRYMDTGTLRDLVNEHPMDLAEASRLIVQIAGALDYAHRNGVIHRDVKPSNVLIDSEGNSYLTDFGIAKIVEATIELTRTGTAMGTPQYMSPEQCRGDKKLTAATDIYSLGVMMYQMVTGRVPFDADTPLAVIHQHLNDPLPPPRQINPEISEAMEKVLLKALAKDPEDRYSTAAEFAAAVSGAGRAAPTERAPVASAAAPLPAKPKSESGGLRRFWWVGASLGALGLIAVLAIGFWSRPRTEERVEETASDVPAALATSQLAAVAPTAGIVLAEETTTPSGPAFASYEAVSVNLGSANLEFGLMQLDFDGDGLTGPVTIGGRDARVTISTGAPTRYIYIHIDPSFIFRQESEVLVSVEYFDKGSQMFGLDYDSNDPAAPISGAFKSTEMVQLENSGQWRTATFHFNDAYFADRQHDGADFRISTSDDDLYVDQVTVARPGGAIAEAISDPWGHVFLGPGEAIAIGIAAGVGHPDAAVFAVEQVDAARLAVEQFGPIRGFAVEVLEADSGCTPELGYAAANQLVSASRLAAVVGTSCSAALDEAMRVFDGARVVFISPSATQNHLSEAGLGTFNRMSFPERVKSDAENFENDPGNPAFQEFAAAFEERYGRPCCEPTASQAYDAARILLNAIEAVAVVDEAGSLVIPREKLANLIRETRGWPGASGEIYINEIGDRVLP